MKARWISVLALIVLVVMPLIVWRWVKTSPPYMTVMSIGNGKQTVVIFKQQNHWCIGYWHDIKRGSFCDLSLATDGDDVYFQQTDQRGRPRVRSFFR